MKKLIVLIALVVGIGVTSKAQTKPGDFKFDAETFDFGKIALGKPVTHTFTFTNVGAQPIIISKVETTCGCTVPKYTEAPIAPNAKGTIEVTFNAAAGPAPFSKGITITSNAKTPTKVLIIKGETVEGSTK